MGGLSSSRREQRWLFRGGERATGRLEIGLAADRPGSDTAVLTGMDKADGLFVKRGAVWIDARSCEQTSQGK